MSKHTPGPWGSRIGYDRGEPADEPDPTTEIADLSPYYQGWASDVKDGTTGLSLEAWAVQFEEGRRRLGEWPENQLAAINAACYRK